MSDKCKQRLAYLEENENTSREMLNAISYVYDVLVTSALVAEDIFGANATPQYILGIYDRIVSKCNLSEAIRACKNDASWAEEDVEALPDLVYDSEAAPSHEFR